MYNLEMSKVQFRYAKIEDAYLMNEVLRDADRRELEASSGREALKVLVDSIRISTKSIVGLYDGKIIALFGVAPEVLLEGRGCVLSLIHI